MPTHTPAVRPARKAPAFEPTYVVVLSPEVTRQINRELRQIDRDFRARIKAIRSSERRTRKTAAASATANT
jgi:hypothetical protein